MNKKKPPIKIKKNNIVVDFLKESCWKESDLICPEILLDDAVKALQQIATNTSEICLHLENIVQVIYSIHAQRYNMPSRWIADDIHEN